MKEAVFDIRDYGAAETNSAAENTAAIQRAIDAATLGACAARQCVVIPSGTFVSGTIWLRSHVELRLEKGAVLKGSVRQEDYNANDEFPENFWSADEDSRFPHYKYGLKLHPTNRKWFRPGPMVAFFLSKNIQLKGITLANPPAWTAHFRCCDGLDICGATIDADRTIANSDGFSIDCTRNVTVVDCTIKTGDDAFAIRASCRMPGHAESHPCENIRIQNCDVWSCCYGIRFGVGTGTIRNVEVEECCFHESAQGINFSTSWIPGAKGVYIGNIRVLRCEILECACPVGMFVCSDDWQICDVTFEDCRFESLNPISLGAKAGRKPERITFRNCSRKCLERLKVRHHRGYGGPKDERLFDDNNCVARLVVENCREFRS